MGAAQNISTDFLTSSMFSIESVEMWRIIIPPKHLNHDTIEDADRWHNCPLLHPSKAKVFRISRCASILHRLRG
jgi:hypothetical protein